MKRLDKMKVIAGVVCVVALLQVALAGVAFFCRHGVERELQIVRSEIGRLTAQAAGAAGGEPPPQPPPQPPQRWTLLEEANVSGTLEVVQGLGDAAEIHFTNVKASPSTTVGKQPFQITGTGTVAQVCAFVASLEQHDRLIVVETGRLSPAPDGCVQFDLGLATYHGGGGQ